MVIFHAFAQNPPWAALHQILFPVAVADVITYDKFFGDRSREVDFVCVRGSRIGDTHRQSLSPLILCCLYWAASDALFKT